MRPRRYRPKARFLPNYANLITKDWQIGGFALYQSGAYLTPPASPPLNFLTSEDIRVAGQPLYNVDVNNIHSYNPGSQQVLNPAAWQILSAPSRAALPAGSITQSAQARSETPSASVRYEPPSGTAS